MNQGVFNISGIKNFCLLKFLRFLTEPTVYDRRGAPTRRAYRSALKIVRIFRYSGSSIGIDEASAAAQAATLPAASAKYAAFLYFGVQLKEEENAKI